MLKIIYRHERKSKTKLGTCYTSIEKTYAELREISGVGRNFKISWNVMSKVQFGKTLDVFFTQIPSHEFRVRGWSAVLSSFIVALFHLHTVFFHSVQAHILILGQNFQPRWYQELQILISADASSDSESADASTVIDFPSTVFSSFRR